MWDTSGKLLTSAFVGAGTSGTLDETFRYTAITPYALVIGKHYIVGAYEPEDQASSWKAGQGGTAALNLNLNYFADRLVDATSLSFPSNTAGTDGAWLGANFLLEAAVPEPASWALMLVGFGALGMAMRRARTPVRVTN
ncbi:MAG: PEPxxWA-CTERM sorting domain-containing protein [Janthinobacterium lividum]